MKRDDRHTIIRAGIAAYKTERIKALEEALAFYADSKNWRSSSTGFAAQYDPRPSPVQADCGIRARKALGKKEADQ